MSQKLIGKVKELEERWNLAPGDRLNPAVEARIESLPQSVIIAYLAIYDTVTERRSLDSAYYWDKERNLRIVAKLLADKERISIRLSQLTPLELLIMRSIVQG